MRSTYQPKGMLGKVGDYLKAIGVCGLAGLTGCGDVSDFEEIGSDFPRQISVVGAGDGENSNLFSKWKEKDFSNSVFAKVNKDDERQFTLDIENLGKYQGNKDFEAKLFFVRQDTDSQYKNDNKITLTTNKVLERPENLWLFGIDGLFGSRTNKVYIDNIINEIQNQGWNGIRGNLGFINKAVRLNLKAGYKDKQVDLETRLQDGTVLGEDSSKETSRFYSLGGDVNLSDNSWINFECAGDEKDIASKLGYSQLIKEKLGLSAGVSYQKFGSIDNLVGYTFMLGFGDNQNRVNTIRNFIDRNSFSTEWLYGRNEPLVDNLNLISDFCMKETNLLEQPALNLYLVLRGNSKNLREAGVIGAYSFQKNDENSSLHRLLWGLAVNNEKNSIIVGYQYKK